MLLDANVLMRFTLDDHAVLSEQATEWFKRAEVGELILIVSGVVLAECVYTLKSFYKMDRAQVATGLQNLLTLPGVESLEGAVLREALRLFGEKNVDFADAYLAALSQGLGSQGLGVSVGSFDRDLAKLGATLLE